MAKNKNSFRTVLNLGITGFTIYSALSPAQKARVKTTFAGVPDQVKSVLTKLKDQVRATD